MLECPVFKALLPVNVPRSSVALLASGGADSSVLLARLLEIYQAVYPIYIRSGFSWEAAEEQALKRFLAAVRGPGLGRLKQLELPVKDIYGDDQTDDNSLVRPADESLYLPGKNLLLVSKAMLWCGINSVDVLALGPMRSSASESEADEFFGQFEQTARCGMSHPVRIIRPFARLSKSCILEMGRDLPLECTFSCIRPAYDSRYGAIHCGCCPKCLERREAFVQARIADRTRYASENRVVALA